MRIDAELERTPPGTGSKQIEAALAKNRKDRQWARIWPH